MNLHWKIDNEREGKPEQFDAAFGTIFRITLKRVFKEKLHTVFTFSLNKAG